MGKDRHWKNFWKNMIHIDIKIRVAQQTRLFSLIKMNRHWKKDD